MGSPLVVLTFHYTLRTSGAAKPAHEYENAPSRANHVKTRPDGQLSTGQGRTCGIAVERRLDKTNVQGCRRPMFTAQDIHYEIADRTRGLASGGIGALHALARQVGLIDAIDDRLHLLKFHFPYHESDHVLTFAYNVLSRCGQTG
jgi:hypothetical protein